MEGTRLGVRRTQGRPEGEALPQEPWENLHVVLSGWNIYVLAKSLRVLCKKENTFPGRQQLGGPIVQSVVGFQ